MIVMVFVSSIFHQLFLVKANSGTNLSFVVTNKQQLSFLSSGKLSAYCFHIHQMAQKAFPSKEVGMVKEIACLYSDESYHVKRSSHEPIAAAE